MSPRMVLAIGLAWILLNGGVASAQDQSVVEAQAAKIRELEKKVEDLEALIRRVESKIAVPPPAPSQPSAPNPTDAAPSTLPSAPLGASTGLPVHAHPTSFQEGTNPVPQDMQGAGLLSGTDNKVGTSGWDKGFYIQSANQEHTLRITGQIQTDYRQFLNSNDTADISTFLLRRARLGIEANVFQYYEFRFLPDFGQGKATIQDSYLNVHYIDALQFQVGKFKEPVSYEQLVQDRFVPTLERSLIDQLVPARDVGVMVHGQKMFVDQFDWAMGLFNGEINGGSGPPAPDSDTNRLRDFAARVAWRPFNYECLPECMHYFQVGISGTTGVENEAMNPNTLKLPSTTPFFVFNSTVVANGMRERLTPEVSYFYGSFGAAAQYYWEDQTVSPTSTSKLLVDVPFRGGYGMMTYLLTGEQRTTYSMPIDPLRPFDPFHPFAKPGAWELVARASNLDVGEVVFAKGASRLADPTKYATNVSEVTVGFNWYLNSLVRMQFNYEHGWFNNPVLLGTTYFRQSNALLTRFQIIF